MNGPLVPVPTPAERAANQRALSKLHGGNRFRLMFGMPLLPENRHTPRRMIPTVETMTPYQRAEAWHRRLGSHMTFAEVIQAHGEMGYVHATPEVFVLARRVEADWEDDRLCDLEFTAPEGDCWHVWLLAGDFRKAMAFLPCPLPYFSFHRRDRLIIMTHAAILRLTNSR